MHQRITAERLQVTATERCVSVDYQRWHVRYDTDPDTVAGPPGPIVMGPIIVDAEEVTS